MKHMLAGRNHASHPRIFDDRHADDALDLVASSLSWFAVIIVRSVFGRDERRRNDSAGPVLLLRKQHHHLRQCVNHQDAAEQPVRFQVQEVARLTVQVERDHQT